MDYEKLYKEALERAKNEYQTHKSFNGFREMLAHVFPELCESEDEKIRKALLSEFIHLQSKGYKFAGLEGEEIIAWLEKQGETYTKKDVHDAYIKGMFFAKDKLEKQGEQKSLNDVAKVITKNKETAMSFLKSCGIMNANGELADEYKVEQGEQKFIDKVEPRFNVGDWITNGKLLVGQVTSFDGEYYHYICDGLEQPLHVSNVHRWHLWTIQDAKDGDVLCCESGWTCLFKALDNHTNTFSSYCFMDSDKWFCNTGSEGHTLDKAFIKAYNGEIHPATKKQRDLLFQKMKEAGYEWDAEKKELNGIATYCQENCKGYQETGRCFADGECEAKKNVETGWSEEDRTMAFTLMRDVDQMSYVSKEGKNERIGWLNSLDEKFASRESSWSEEDDSMVEDVRNSFEFHCDEMTEALQEQYNKFFDKVKSLKPQKQWKPSEEQINALKEACDKHWEPDGLDPLYTLYEHLKKLRE